MPTIDYPDMTKEELQNELIGLQEELTVAHLHVAGTEEDIRAVKEELERR